MQTEFNHLREQILQAASKGTQLTIQGGGSKAFYGEQVATEHILDTNAYSGIVEYDAPELVITARCGTPLLEIEAALAEKGQMLAFEPPHFGKHATIGGAVAAGLSGPRRPHAGAVRDFILGTKLLNGKGEHLEFGGQVMKNVAGYDVSRLLTGSMGTLGVITEVSLKVLPRSVASKTVVFDYDVHTALKQMNTWMGRPLPISATLWQDGQLYLRFSGARAAVDYAIETLGCTLVDNEFADGLWADLREHQLPFFNERSDKQTLWRIAVPDTAPYFDLGGSQIVEWGGSLRWVNTQTDAQTVRDLTARHGGHATAFKSAQAGVPVFTPATNAHLAIQQRLKDAFDPAHIFNIGRLYPQY